MAAAAVAHISLNTGASENIWALGVAATGTARALDADSQIVARCLAGDQGAWEDLIQDTYPACLSRSATGLPAEITKRKI